jgi:hypothetical protein
MSIRKIALVLVGAALLGGATTASAADPVRYPAKFICDAFQPEGLSSLVAVTGDYRTAINVFNPTTKPITVLRTFARSALVGGGTTTNDTIILQPMRATVIDCSTIAGAIFGTPFGQLPGQGFEGFVTLSTNEVLDIAAIYTSGSMKNGTASVQVLVINPKKGMLEPVGTKR